MVQNLLLWKLARIETNKQNPHLFWYYLKKVPYNQTIDEAKFPRYKYSSKQIIKNWQI